MKFLVVFLVLCLFASINGFTIVPVNNNGINQKTGRRFPTLRDNHGCDAVIQSCGHRGECCDVHDACYHQYGCTEHSWITMCKCT